METTISPELTINTPMETTISPELTINTPNVFYFDVKEILLYSDQCAIAALLARKISHEFREQVVLSFDNLMGTGKGKPSIIKAGVWPESKKQKEYGIQEVSIIPIEEKARHLFYSDPETGEFFFIRREPLPKEYGIWTINPQNQTFELSTPCELNSIVALDIEKEIEDLIKSRENKASLVVQKTEVENENVILISSGRLSSFDNNFKVFKLRSNAEYRFYYEPGRIAGGVKL